MCVQTYILYITFKIMKEKIVLRLATRKDRLGLHDVNKQSLPVVYSEQDWEDIIKMKHTYILTVSADIVAYCACDNTGCIMSFAVLENHRQKGFGKKLLQYTITNMKNKFDKLYLRVKVSNGIAQKLYTSLGFISTQTINKYYSNTEDAYFMELKLIDL